MPQAIIRRGRPAPRNLDRNPLRVSSVPWEGLVFLVESQRSNPEDPDWISNAEHPPYRVELEAGKITTPDGKVIYNGTCTCPRFWPGPHHKAVREGRVARCPHIKAAIWSIYDRLMNNYVISRNRTRRILSTFSSRKS